MKIALYAAAALVALVLVILIVGYALPQSHQAVREKTFPASPERVFAAITTPQDFPRWRSDVKRVELLPQGDGKARFREIGGNGEVLYEIEESTPPRRLVTRIADTSLPFGGRWTYELSPSGSGTTLRITEDGEVYNPIFRFMSRFVFGQTASMDSYLSSLEKHLGSG